MSYQEFCQSVVDDVNRDAVAHGDSILSVDDVMGTDEAVSAYIATCEIAENLSHV